MTAPATNLKTRVHPNNHPLGPMLIFSYGMTKCGSTLAFELARTAMEMAGYDQPKLPQPFVPENKRINFIDDFPAHQINRLLDQIRSLGHPVIVKTHNRPHPAMIDLINAGDARVHACYRDPREMALSLLDHGQIARQKRETAFANMLTLDHAKADILSQIDTLTQWLYRPHCLPLYYEDIAFDTHKTSCRILENLCLDIDPMLLVQHVTRRRFIQFNKGIRRRYKSEMHILDQKQFKRTFAPMYRELIKNRHLLPDDGSPVLKEPFLLYKTMR